MKRTSIGTWGIVLAAVTAFHCSPAPAAAQVTTVTWEKTAAGLYDEGFMHMLMKAPDGGVCLFNNVPVENDSPGAGVSMKGVNTDSIWGSSYGRKVLMLDDPRAEKAWLFVFSSRVGKHPLVFRVNGHAAQIDKIKRGTYERFYWVEFPAAWLVKGKNTIDFSCPEAKTEADGWAVWLSRADEFAQGGGDPADVGKTSFKSGDGGETWKESPFGPLGNDRCEYSVRLCLSRHVPSGMLESPVVDLWRENAGDPIVRQHTIRKLTLAFAADVPSGASVEYFYRKGINPGPFAEGWEEWEPAGSGPAVVLDIEGDRFHRRFIQFRAVLSTTNPLVSPVLRSMKAVAAFQEPYPVPRHTNIHVLAEDNPPIAYSSVDWKWEASDRPEFAELRKRENLDRIIAGSRTQFEAQMKLLEYAAKRWRWVPPNPDHPGWDALSILDRINMEGGGGMCIQFNLLLGGACQAYGWQTRLINIDGHEVCEVWNDDYGKWIYMDAADLNHVLCDPATGEPLSVLDLHRIYLDYFHPDRAMDWQNDYRPDDSLILKRADKPPIVRSSSTYHDQPEGAWGGFIQSRIMRLIPRNNWYEQPYPRPLSHGDGSHWPWDGYVNWYDERTPPRIQYSVFTDRPRDLYPDLNTVHITATQGYGNDQLYLQFETYTPNFSHYEVSLDDGPWEETADSYVWLLAPGKNTIQVRAASKLAVKGKPASLAINHVLMPHKEWEMQ